MTKAMLCLSASMLILSLAGCSRPSEVRPDSTLSPGHVRPPTVEPESEGTPTAGSEPGLGLLAYVRGGDIWIRELPHGEPRRLTSDGCNARPLWSTSGNLLLFYKEGALWIMTADRWDARPLFASLGAEQVAWSPVEDCLAYIDSRSAIVLVEFEDGRPAMLVPPACCVTDLAWSPDGNWLAYTLVEWAQAGIAEAPVRSFLNLMRRDGNLTSRLLQTETIPEAPVLFLAGWSGDGSRIYFWQGPASPSVQADGLTLMSISRDGGSSQIHPVTTLIRDDFFSPRPGSPDVAVVAGSGRIAWLEKELVLLDAAAAIRVTLSASGQAVSSPAWSPDGRYLAYAAMPEPADTDAPAVGGQIGNEALNRRRIWIVSASGEDRRPLTNDATYRDEHPLWSADGEHLLFARIRGQETSLWLVGRDGEELFSAAEGLGPSEGYQGYHGLIDWGELFDWWQGPGNSPPPARADTVTNSAGGTAWLGAVAFLEAVLGVGSSVRPSPKGLSASLSGCTIVLALCRAGHATPRASHCVPDAKVPTAPGPPEVSLKARRRPLDPPRGGCMSRVLCPTLKSESRCPAYVHWRA